MLKFEWNALRPGDTVVVHQPGDEQRDAIPGVVVLIDGHIARKGTNGVGIRVASADGSTRLLWPSRLTVHGDRHDADEPCWRCDTAVAV